MTMMIMSKIQRRLIMDDGHLQYDGRAYKLSVRLWVADTSWWDRWDVIWYDACRVGRAHSSHHLMSDRVLLSPLNCTIFPYVMTPSAASLRPACSFARTHRQTTAIFNLVGGRDRRTDGRVTETQWVGRRHGDLVALASPRTFGCKSNDVGSLARRYVCRRRRRLARKDPRNYSRRPQYI